MTPPKRTQEFGPLHGVPLIDSLPLGSGFQAMPSLADLRAVMAVSERTVAGYEVLLSYYREVERQNAELREKLRAVGAAIPSTRPIDL